MDQSKGELLNNHNANIELHIFTNSTVNAPSIEHIVKTYKSFVDTFSLKLEPTIWCDPNPNIRKSDAYMKKLKGFFDTVHLTSSLSDGYIRAIESSKSEFMFMLEHDWIFDNIDHGLDEILSVMKVDQIVHLRFNQRDNIVYKSDKYLQEVDAKIFKYCLTPSVSNNPHIINTNLYREKALTHLKRVDGSYGIEEVLGEVENIEGSIYGGLNHPRTIIHTDGRSNFQNRISVIDKVKSILRRI